MRELFVIFTLLLLASPVLAMPINSTITCNTNQTLQENITVYKDGNSTNLSLSTYCPYDCDNVTKACNPPKYVANLTAFAVFGAFMVGLVLVYRWLR